MISKKSGGGQQINATTNGIALGRNSDTPTEAGLNSSKLGHKQLMGGTSHDGNNVFKLINRSITQQ